MYIGHNIYDYEPQILFYGFSLGEYGDMWGKNVCFRAATPLSLKDPSTERTLQTEGNGHLCYVKKEPPPGPDGQRHFFFLNIFRIAPGLPNITELVLITKYTYIYAIVYCVISFIHQCYHFYQIS